MSNQLQATGAVKVRSLTGVLVGTSGVVTSLNIDGSLGIPQLDVNGKILVSQLPNSVMEYKGTWDASTNTPTLVNGTGNAGDVYLCNVAGTVNFGAGPISFVVSDQVIYSGSIWQKASGSNGTVTSVAVTESGDALTITGSPITTSGTINIGFAGTNLQYVNGAGNLTTFPTLISSIGLSMPSAFSVSNSPLTANGTIAVTGAGYPSQYIRGDGTLADFPTSGGGGSSVSYYLNGGTSQGTIGGVTYYEMSKTADTGTMADFSLTGNGFIVAFLTDAGDPAQLNIPAGNWNYEIYASMSANGGTPEMYAELYKYDGTTFTLIATSPHEILYDGTALNLYTFAMTVPSTTLAITDRLAVKLYATNSGGKTTTVHTQDSHLCQIITTFSTGITALNGLTAQVQYFGTGTSGTDFNISSVTATHTFNLPVASAANTGKLSSTDWSTFNGKVPYTGAITDLNLGANLLRFTTEASDNASIGTTVSGSSSYFDFNLSDDNNQEEWRFRFTPSGGSVYDAVRIRPVSATKSDLLVSGDIGASNFSGSSGGTNTGDVTIGTANGLSLASQVLSLAAASASVTGALTSTDWSSFNSKISSQWTTSGSDIFYNTGNVSVNTTTSGTGRFFVAADTDSGITIRNTGTADRFQLFVGSTGGATYTADNAIIKGTNTAIDFYNGSTATKKVTIPNSGNYLEVYGDAYVQSYVKIGNGSGNYTALTTIASGTKIVTFPNATGTVALTSDIPSLTGYVPYTGATTNLDMGANGLYANNLTIRKISTSATIDFPNTGTMNDPAFIKHTESPDNTAVMSFSVGDNDATNDYFVFGNASSGFVERFKITATGVVTIGTWNGTAIGDTYISSAATWNGKVSSVSATSPVVSSGGTTPTISMAAATTSVSGYLTSTDWNTFNNKQSTITNPVTGTGNTSYVPKFSSSSAITDSSIYNGASGFVSIGNTNTSSYNLDVTGSGRVTTTLNVGTTAFVNTDIFIGDTTSGDGRLFITSPSNQGITLRRAGSADRFKMFVGNGTTYTQDNAIILGTNTDIDFYTGSSPVKRLTIANGGTATFSSSITSTQSSGIFLNNSSGGTSSTQIRIDNTGGDVRMGVERSTGGAMQIGTSAYAAVFGNQANAETQFTTNGTVRMTIASGGNVGIGTNAPTALLHLVESTSNLNLYLQNTLSSGKTWSLNSDSTGKFNIHDTTANYFTISSAGLIGIGTTSPNGLLSLKASVTNTPMLLFQNANGGPNSAISAYTTAAQSLIGIGTNSYIDNTSNISKLTAGYEMSMITFDEGIIRMQTSTTGGSPTTRFTLNSAGNLGLSRVSAGNTLEVNGDASKTTAGSWAANSDINIKTDINTIDGALDRINKVRLVSFKYKDAYKEANNGIKDKYYHNVIAQEFQEIYPDYVYDSGDVFEEHKVLQVDTNPMYVDSVSAIQELSKMVIDLQNQINELKNK